ncbi:methyl-CpG-binding domain-containing protein 2-like isoform X3 [Carya illinoinensis]|uniref:Methyl-CpG-binding domain-containing protein 2-like n=1 Tax=Carya illinoinensis TaxID=32201 RepID=A0A8T1N904_CARIL|nr:methyl-CpG-binding domain-containing protein 2-like isoform X3 [Carya illinoinensis]KAG6625524.1 hypothetical protein CIPAW_16G103200 [Carya illinoinensis]KAG6673217.1 hypothetical protein I3842_16G100100 [Carya illinoinensis]KAG6673218.1 hypothetical protein I3842_16G100100 [Carya illinoinensis]
MCSSPEKFSLNVEKEEKDITGSSFLANYDSTLKELEDLSSSSSSSEDESLETEDDDEQSNENASKQLVLYDPLTNGAFTVQCASCFKWRLIPTKEKYEAIREHILEQPFYCETAREWRPDISCDDPTDISQDDSRLWAIDKPNIAQPPPGWQRLLRIRGEGSSRFADIYYQAPSGKKLRSMVEIQKYLLEHPEYMNDDVSLSQFSFQIPKPLQENYVRKRPPQLKASHVTRPLETGEASPLALMGPDDCPDSQLTQPGLPSNFKAPVFDPVGHPTRKRSRAPREDVHGSNQKV